MSWSRGWIYAQYTCQQANFLIRRKSPERLCVVFFAVKYSTSSRKGEEEKLWRELLSNPSEWRDHRSDKRNPRFPDFKHKQTQKSLWLNSKWIPPWVNAELTALAPGTIETSIFSLNQRLSRYVQAGHHEKALQLFHHMQRDRIMADRFTFVPVLNACASLGLLDDGRRIHTQITQEGLEADLFIGSSLVDMYAKCWSIEEAAGVFNHMPTRDVVAWTTMTRGFVKCGEGHRALQLFEQMQLEGVDPNPVTFVAVLNACASIAAIEEGRRAHEEVIRRGYESDICVGNSVLDMYAKCGCIEEAERVFKRMPTRDVVAWTAMILGFVKCEQVQYALELFEQMKREGVDPNPVTFVVILNACASVAALEDGRRAHKEIIQRGFESDGFVGNSLVDMYAKCGCIEEAERVFKRIPKRDVVAWTALILGYVKCGEGQEALELFEQMKREGVAPNSVTFVVVLSACASIAALDEGRRIHGEIIQRGHELDLFVGNSLVDMYAKCGSIEESERVFHQMPTRDVVVWSALILGYVKCQDGQQALELFALMQREGVNPDSGTFVAVLNACASIAALEEGRRVHKEIIQKGYDSDVMVTSSIVDMYAKCGSVEEAECVFNQMPTRDVVAWTAMLAGYSMHGYAREAVAHFEQMCNVVEVDAVSFTSLLSACSHVGLVDEGMDYFKSMSAVYNIPPTMEHYACVIDLLGRAGHLCEAEELIRIMPVEPDVSVWMSLLGACRVHGNVEMGEHAANQVLEMDAKNGAALVLLSNVYATVGKSKRDVGVHEVRLCSDGKRTPAHAWIVENKVDSFVTEDTIHPQIVETQGEVQSFSQQMTGSGYVAYCVNEDKKGFHVYHRSPFCKG